LAATGTLTGAR